MIVSTSTHDVQITSLALNIDGSNQMVLITETFNQLSTVKQRVLFPFFQVLPQVTFMGTAATLLVTPVTVMTTQKMWQGNERCS
jgi:hypothetical protein